MDEFISKGYIHKVTKNELEEAKLRRIWYFPVGAVTKKARQNTNCLGRCCQ